MKEGRQLPARDYLALKAAVRTLVDTAGGANRASEITRSDAPRLSRYGSPHEAMHAPLDVIADLEAEAGAPIVTAVLADMLGFILVPKMAAEKPAETIASGVGEYAKDFGAVLAELGRDLADGKITPDEARRALPLIREANTEGRELEKALEALEALINETGRVVSLGRVS